MSSKVAAGPLSTAALARHHHTDLVRFLRRRGVSHEDARDLAQEAYVKLLRYEGATDIVSPHAMLFAIANHVAVDHLRCTAQQRTRRHVPVVDDELVSEQPSIERQISALEHFRIVRAAIEELPARCRTIFLLSREEGLSNAEIGGRLGISVKAVEKQMSRALRACAHRMAGA